MLTGLAVLLCATVAARAVVVELKDVAPDRIQRQQAEAIGQIPLPGTPNLSQFAERLREKKIDVGSPLFIRAFKAESELEVWMLSGDRFVLFATYPICYWSGTIGPKINEGDRQVPEGIYTVNQRQLHLIGRHPRSLNLGFPNLLDRQYQRTGSYILIHGGCSSVGCLAMTNPVIEEIFSLSQAALKGGQDAIQVQVFPFRMTEDKLRAYATNDWYDFWRNLKDAYDSFERTHLPPKVTICEGRYWIEDSTMAQEVAAQGPLAVCGAPRNSGVSQNEATGNVELDRSLSLPWQPKFVAHPSTLPSPSSAPMVQHPRSLLKHAAAQARLQPSASLGPANLLSSRSNANPSQLLHGGTTRSLLGGPAGLRNASELKKSTTVGVTTPPVQISCNLRLTSCKRWVVLQRSAAIKQAQERSAKRSKFTNREMIQRPAQSGSRS